MRRFPSRRRKLGPWKRRLALLGGTTTWSDCAAVLRCLATLRTIVRGPAVTEFEQAFARQLGVRYAYSFAAGRVGFYGLLRALDIGEGDEVLVPVPTHVVVANAVRYTGAHPVYVDCRLDDYNMDFERAERSVTPRTKALVLQHTFGIPGRIDQALAFSERHGLELIEDCVHSLGATYRGRQLGTFGRAACFSTEETKTISTTMGGFVTTDGADLARRLKAFQAKCAWPPLSLAARYALKLVLYHAFTAPHVHRYARATFEFAGRRNPLPGPTSGAERAAVATPPPDYERRLANVQAIVGIRQLRRLNANVAHRRAVSKAYRARLLEAGLHVPEIPNGAEASFVRYPVLVEDRTAAIRALSEHCVPGTWFTSVLEEADDVMRAEYEIGSCPRAETAAKHLVNLPTHERVQRKDIDAMSQTFAEMTPLKESTRANRDG